MKIINNWSRASNRNAYFSGTLKIKLLVPFIFSPENFAHADFYTADLPCWKRMKLDIQQRWHICWSRHTTWWITLLFRSVYTHHHGIFWLTSMPLLAGMSPENTLKLSLNNSRKMVQEREYCFPSNPSSVDHFWESGAQIFFYFFTLFLRSRETNYSRLSPLTLLFYI